MTHDTAPNDLEEDLAGSPMILTKVKDDRYAQNLYAALCNTDWQKTDVMPILKDELWSCSWRSAGGIVSRLQRKGDYLNWYCSGIWGGDWGEGPVDPTSVAEGVVTDEIKEDLRQLGWHPVPGDEL